MNTDKLSQPLQAAVELLEASEELRPIVSSALTAIGSYGPEFHNLLLRMVIGTADLRIATIQHYKDNGFSDKEALLLTLDSNAGIKEAMRTINSTK